MEKRDNRNSNRNRKPYGENRNSERSSFRHDSRNDSFGERRHGDENSSEDSSNRKSKDLRTGSKNSRFKDTRNDSSSSNDRRNNSHSSRSEGRGERNSSRDDRGEKRFSKNDRNDRKFSSDRDNSKGRFSKDERGEKRFSKNDRDDRKFSSDRDNSKGRFSKDERGEKRFSKNDRNDRRFSKDRDNSRGRFSKDERGESKYPKNNRNDRRFSRAREEREERISRDDFEEGNFIKPETRETSNIEKSVERNSQEDRGERSSTEKDFKTPLKSKYSKKKQLEHNILYGPEDGLVRINRYIANTGFCSRREADRIIAEGKVIINGKVNIEVGRKVSKEDVVSINGKVLEPENKIYILLNKPKDCVTTMDDPMGRRTVLDLIDDACDERVYPVGRLDRTTTGLLIFTNDGDLTKRLTHPSYERKKIYHVHLDNPLDVEDLNQLSLKGVDLEDGNIIPDTVSYVNQSDRRELGIEIHSGKNRIVRRIFEHIGHEVVKLDRVYFAGLTKKNLPRGKWRFLTQREINMLKNF